MANIHLRESYCGILLDVILYNAHLRKKERQVGKNCPSVPMLEATAERHMRVR